MQNSNNDIKAKIDKILGQKGNFQEQTPHYGQPWYLTMYPGYNESANLPYWQDPYQFVRYGV